MPLLDAVEAVEDICGVLSGVSTALLLVRVELIAGQPHPLVVLVKNLGRLGLVVSFDLREGQIRLEDWRRAGRSAS